MKTVIFGAAPIFDYEAIRLLLPKPPFTLIAADGGLRHTKALGFVPDAVIGDMDSLDRDDLPEGAILYPSRKDDTDMMLAVKKALALQSESVLILGGLGGRLDHTYANLQTLAFLAEHNVYGTLADENHLAFMLDSGAALLSPEYKYLSVFAYSGICEGVSITGAEYPLDHATLEPSFPLGVSNRHADGGQMRVTVEKGMLLIIQTKLN